MPDPTPDSAKPAAIPPGEAAPSAGPPNPATPPPERSASSPAAVGRLFRVLVDAGADAVLAYTVVEEAQSMVLENATTQLQPMLVEMRQLFAERDQRFDRMDERFDRMDERFDRMDERLDGMDRKIDALAEAAVERDRAIAELAGELRTFKEVVATRLDAQQRELRLIWGALGVLITMLIAVFGFVFAA